MRSRSSRHQPTLALALAACATLVASGLHGAQPRKATRWERQIRALELKAQENKPPKQGIVFVGSSSIKGWKLEVNFPDLPVIRSGFGGSFVSDSVYYADRIVIPYKPKVVVMYAGGNDIASGKTPQRVAADYGQFVKVVRAALPKTRIVYLAIKPSISRWKLIDKIREANRLIRAQTEKDPLQVFVDIDKPMLGTDGKPRPELFKPDGLHLSPAGYKLWADLLRPHLKVD